jgi:hypothetical protein
MIAALLKLVPFRDYAYAALAAAAVGWFLWHDHTERSIGAAHEAAAVQAASAKAQADATSRLAALNAQYSASLTKVKETYATQMASASTQHAADLQRLRDADRYRKTHTVLDGTAFGAASADAGADSFGALATVSAELADALRQDDAALTQCFTDRDALTGK